MVVTILFILIIVWITIMQLKLNELSDVLRELKVNLLKDKTCQKSDLEAAKDFVHTEKQPEILSASDIPDEDVFGRKSPSMPEFAEPKPDKEKTSNSFENMFLGNIFNKIGAVAILIGLIILIKIVSPYFVFTPQLKIALGYLAGFGMVIGALKLHTKENLKNYSEVLLGTGFGAMFISTYCASGVFEILNFASTAIVSTAFLLAAFYLADRLKTTSMLVISLIAAYCNPIFFNFGFDVPSNFLFGYFIFINLLSLVYTYRNRSRNIVNVVNLSLSFFVALILCYGIKLTGPVILWTIYLIYGLITPQNSKSSRALNYINLGVFTIFLLLFFEENTSHLLPATSAYMPIGYAELILAAIYGCICYLQEKSGESFRHYLNLSLWAAFLAVLFICMEAPTTKCLVWSVEIIVLAYYASRYKLNQLASWAVALSGAVVVCSMIPADGVFALKSISGYTPVWNIRLAVFLPFITASALAYYILDRVDGDRFQKLSEYFRFMCISFIYLYMGLELNNFITWRFVGVNTNADFMNKMLNAILCFVYAINLKRIQMTVKHFEPFFEAAAALSGIIALIMIVFAGVHYRPVHAFIPVINLRAVAFLTGICASVLYAGWTDKKTFKYLAVLLGFILLHYETADLISKYEITGGSYLISVGWILYSGIITTTGIFKNLDYLKISGIGLCILSIFRIFLYDLAHIDIMYKFIAIVTLGIILMILSYLYNKKSSR